MVTTSSRAARKAERRYIRAASARYDAQYQLQERQREAEAALKRRCRDEDLVFFDWDTDYMAATLKGHRRPRYLKERAYLREVLFREEDYRYDREHIHVFLSPIWDRGQIALNKALNGFERLRGSDLEWGIG